jgi:hypothetical protein
VKNGLDAARLLASKMSDRSFGISGCLEIQEDEQDVVFMLNKGNVLRVQSQTDLTSVVGYPNITTEIVIQKRFLLRTCVFP